MRIVITDSSCLIDLKKGSLLRAMLELPYEFAIPQPLIDDELLSLTNAEKEELVEAGLQVVTLSGAQLSTVMRYRGEDPRPSVNDYFALVLSEETEESILLTGDGALRTIAEQKQVEVHGAIWVLLFCRADRVIGAGQIDRRKRLLKRQTGVHAVRKYSKRRAVDHFGLFVCDGHFIHTLRREPPRRHV